MSKLLKILSFAVLTIGQFSIDRPVHARCPAGLPSDTGGNCIPPYIFDPSAPKPGGSAEPVSNRSTETVSRPIPGMPRDVYIPHASVVMWVDNNGDAQYSAAVAQHSSTFFMSMQGCRAQNGGSAANCQMVFDAKAAVLAVIKASDGGFYFVTGSNKSEARKKGLEACAKRTNVTCKLDKFYGS
jgi:hypothetical protein